YKKRMADFGVTDKALKDMQEFDMALEGAGIKIKSTLIETLSTLAPELKMLSDGLSDAAKQLIGSQGFKDAIHWVAQGLHEFGEYVNKPAFKQDIKDLADGISYAAKKMIEWSRDIGLLPESKAEAEKKEQERREKLARDPLNKLLGPVLDWMGVPNNSQPNPLAAPGPKSLKIP